VLRPAARWSGYGPSVRGVWLGLVLMLVAGCTAVDGGPSGSTTSAERTALSLPPRPREVRLDGVEPCSLLTEQQRVELGLDGKPSASTKPSALFGGEETVCIFSGFNPRAVSIGVGVVTTAGVEIFASGKLDAEVTVVKVREFPAVRAVPTRFTDFCSVLVDLAPGQLLDIQYANGGRKPPIPQGQLCEGAEQVASAATATLLAS
jgi:hypothetical protein